MVQITEASPEKPCLGLMLKLDQREISQLMADSSLSLPRPKQSSRGMATGEVTLPLRIDDLAARANMSTSTFHHHFRTLTAMSPLQLQKMLRPGA